MSIKTSKIKVQPLRGMDKRFNPHPTKARLVEDMTWTTEDSWKEAGGFDYIATKYTTKKDATHEIEMHSGNGKFIKKFQKIHVSYPVDNSELQWETDCPEREQDKDRSKEEDIESVQQYAPPSNATPDDNSIVSLTVSNSALISQFAEDRNTSNTDPKVSAYERVKIDAPVNMHWFAQFNGGIQWLIYELEDGTLLRFYGAGGNIEPWKELYHIDGRPIVGNNFASNWQIPKSHKRHVRVDKSWENTHFYTFASRVYMVNGKNEPLVFDGRKCARAGFAVQPAIKNVARNYFEESSSNEYKYKAYSTIQGLGYNADHQRPDPELENLGETWDSKWKYSYRVSYLNERGQESPLSEAAVVRGRNYYSTDSGKSVYGNVTVSLPIGPVGTVARRIYRTQNLYDAKNQPRSAVFNNEFYYVMEIQDNITSIYNDSIPDNQLGAMKTENLVKWPTAANRISAFKNTMFIASSDENILYYSNPRQPEEFPAMNYFEIGDSISGPIVALYPTKNALVVLKRYGIYLIKGDPLNGFFAFTLTKDIGCIASKSIREIPGKGLAFLGDKGVFLLEGALEDTGTITGITRISDGIEKVLRRLNKPGSESTRSCINRSEAEYWLNIPVDSEVRPNLLLKFHFEIGEWSISENFRANDILCTGDHRNKTYLACSDTTSTNRGLMVYSHAFTKKGTTAIAPLYKTVHMSVGSFYSSFDVVRVQIMAVGYGENKMKCNFLVNREINNAMTSDIERNQKRVLEDNLAPLFGTATLDGTYNFAEHRPVPVRFDVNAMHKGPVQEISFSFAPAGQRIQILGYQIEVRVGSTKEVVTLTEAFGGTLTR